MFLMILQGKAPAPMLLTVAFTLTILTLKAVRKTWVRPRCVLLTTTGATHLANFSDEESDEDGQGHGTHVAGTIGSRMFEHKVRNLLH